MTVATVTEGELYSENPFETSLMSNEDVHTSFDIEEKIVDVRIDGTWYHLTHHAVERFMRRTDREVESMFPHLDFSDRVQALYAIVVMLQDSVWGSFKNRSNGGDCFYHNGWIFVVVSEGGAHKIVTCYPKGSRTRFFKA